MENQPPTLRDAVGNDCPLIDTEEREDVGDIERDLELDGEEFNWYLGE
jgi:hypothetical protein